MRRVTADDPDLEPPPPSPPPRRTRDGFSPVPSRSIRPCVAVQCDGYPRCQEKSGPRWRLVGLSSRAADKTNALLETRGPAEHLPGFNACLGLPAPGSARGGGDARAAT
ncbi:unnamed protein product [Lampetra fluviatilis]